MPEISNKKKKFIKRNFKQLSIEELARKTSLKPNVIKSLIIEYGAEKPREDQHAHIKKEANNLLSWKTILLTSLLFAAVAIIIYFPSLKGEFIFDDRGSIKDNPLIHITGISQLFDILFSKEVSRKIGYVSFAINFYFGGLNTFGYHLVNVIIHILNGLILFLLSYTILTLPSNEGKVGRNAFKISFLGSLLWMVHPIQTQAVSYIVQRLTSLSALFFLLSLLFYIKGRIYQAHKRLALFILSTLFGLLALGTKENTATLPLFIVLSEFFFFQSYPFRMERKKLGLIIPFLSLFILIAGIYLGSDFISRSAQQYQKMGWTPLERMLTQLRVVIFYLSLLIYPHPSRLNMDYDFAVSHSLFSPFTTFLSLLFVLGSLGLAFRFVKRQRLISYAILWYFGNLVIESSILPLELVFEHRLYLPSAGIIMLCTGICVSLSKGVWTKWVTVLIIPLIFLFSYWTYERASVWRREISAWTDAAKKSPHKARPHYNLGNSYSRKGMVDEAIAAYKQALVMSPSYAKLRYNLGKAYSKKGMMDDAISEYKQALLIDPNHAKARTNLGLIYVNTGRLKEGVAEYKKAIAINSNLKEVHNNLGSVYFEKGRLDEAISEFKKAIVINPTYAQAHINLGVSYYKKGNYKLAIFHYDRATELGVRVDPKLLESLKPYR